MCPPEPCIWREARKIHAPLKWTRNGDETLAIGWLTALKIIPWGDVLAAAPHIVKGAKRLFASTKVDTSDPPATSTTAPTNLFSDDDKFANLDNRIQQIHAKVIELGDEQQSSAELIKSLAEQNAHVVAAIEVLRIRTKILIIACISLAIAVAVLAFWVAGK